MNGINEKPGRRGIFVLLVLLFTQIGQVRAEQLPIKSYTTADGLARDAINCIMRDSRGFLPGANRYLLSETGRARSGLILRAYLGSFRNLTPRSCRRPFSSMSTEQMRITSGGSVGIGVPLPADKLEVACDIRIGTGGNGCVRSSNVTVIAGTCSSDRRFKRSITPFSSTLDKFVRLQPVYFYWRAAEYPEKGFGNELSFGLGAQDVEPVMPDLVAEDEKGFKLVRYHKLPFVMLQAIKDLRAEKDAEVEALKSENAALKEQNEDFEARLRLLERAFQNKVASGKTRGKRSIKPTPSVRR